MCFLSSCVFAAEEKKDKEIDDKIEIEDNILVINQVNVKKAIEENKFLFVEFCKYSFKKDIFI